MAGNGGLIGLVGVLTAATRGSRGPGEVQLRVRGGEETYFAWSSEALPRGQTVLVVESRADAHLDVVAWVDPLARPRANTACNQPV